MKYVIIGCSAAGVNAAGAIREADPDGEIVLVTREHAGHYSRPMLSYFVAGTVNEEQLLYRGKDYLDRVRATLEQGREIVRVDVAGRQVIDSAGGSLSYDRLLIVSGGIARQPDIPGIDLDGVFHFRTLDDARQVRDWAERTEVCVTLGGGLVSLKAAEALRKRGVKAVHLVIGSNRVMSQAMDLEGAQFLFHQLLFQLNGLQFLPDGLLFGFTRLQLLLEHLDFPFQVLEFPLAILIQVLGKEDRDAKKQAKEEGSNRTFHRVVPRRTGPGWWDKDPR